MTAPNHTGRVGRSRARPLEHPGRGELPQKRRLPPVRPVAIAWAAVLWVALWGDLSTANVLSGALLGLLVTTVFPMTPVRIWVRVRPLALLWLVLHFVADVTVASVEVIGVIMRGKPVRSAVVQVDLRTPSDFVLTMVAGMTSLVPGSLVVEVRRSTNTLFLHLLDTPDAAAAEQGRRLALELEDRVVRALGANPRTTAEPTTTPHGGEDR